MPWKLCVGVVLFSMVLLHAPVLWFSGLPLPTPPEDSLRVPLDGELLWPPAVETFSFSVFFARFKCLRTSETKLAKTICKNIQYTMFTDKTNWQYIYIYITWCYCRIVQHALKNSKYEHVDIWYSILILNVWIKQTQINKEYVPEQGKQLSEDLQLRRPTHGHLALTRTHSAPQPFQFQQEKKNLQVIGSQIAPENQNIKNWGQVHLPTTGVFNLFIVVS